MKKYILFLCGGMLFVIPFFVFVILRAQAADEAVLQEARFDTIGKSLTLCVKYTSVPIVDTPYILNVEIPGVFKFPRTWGMIGEYNSQNPDCRYSLSLSQDQISSMFAVYPSGVATVNMSLRFGTQGDPMSSYYDSARLVLESSSNFQFRIFGDNHVYKIGVVQVVPPGFDLAQKKICLVKNSYFSTKGYNVQGSGGENSCSEVVPSNEYITTEEVKVADLLFSDNVYTTLSNIMKFPFDSPENIKIYSIKHVGDYLEGLLAKHNIRDIDTPLGKNPRFSTTLLDPVQAENNPGTNNLSVLDGFFRDIVLKNNLDVSGFDYVIYVWYYPGNLNGGFYRSNADYRGAKISFSLSSPSIAQNTGFMSITHELAHTVFGLLDTYDGYSIVYPQGVPDPINFPQRYSCLMNKMFGMSKSGSNRASIYDTVNLVGFTESPYLPTFEGVSRYYTSNPENFVLCAEDIKRIIGGENQSCSLTDFYAGKCGECNSINYLNCSNSSSVIPSSPVTTTSVTTTAPVATTIPTTSTVIPTTIPTATTQTQTIANLQTQLQNLQQQLVVLQEQQNAEELTSQAISVATIPPSSATILSISTSTPPSTTLPVQTTTATTQADITATVANEAIPQKVRYNPIDRTLSLCVKYANIPVVNTPYHLKTEISGISALPSLWGMIGEYNSQNSDCRYWINLSQEQISSINRTYPSGSIPVKMSLRFGTKGDPMSSYYDSARLVAELSGSFQLAGATQTVTVPAEVSSPVTTPATFSSTTQTQPVTSVTTVTTSPTTVLTPTTSTYTATTTQQTVSATTTSSVQSTVTSVTTQTSVSPGFSFVFPVAGWNLEKGVNYTISWRYASNIGDLSTVRMSLYKNGIYKDFIAVDAPNSGSYIWSVPTNLETGSDYSIRLFNLKYSNDYVDSPRFSVVSAASQTTSTTAQTVAPSTATSQSTTSGSSSQTNTIQSTITNTTQTSTTPSTTSTTPTTQQSTTPSTTTTTTTTTTTSSISTPTASIDSVTPASPVIGQVVTFIGSGHGGTGSFKYYYWGMWKESTFLGVFGSSASATYTFTSAGNYTVKFQAQDTNDKWSELVNSAISVQATESSAVSAVPTTSILTRSPALASVLSSMTQLLSEISEKIKLLK